MNEITGVTGNYRLRLELIDITKKLAPEKLAAVLESLSPVGLSDLINYPLPEMEKSNYSPRSKGKELLEQSLLIIK